MFRIICSVAGLSRKKQTNASNGSKQKGFLDDKNYALKTLLQKYRQKRFSGNDATAFKKRRDRQVDNRRSYGFHRTHEYEEKAFENFIDKETRYKDWILHGKKYIVKHCDWGLISLLFIYMLKNMIRIHFVSI